MPFRIYCVPLFRYTQEGETVWPSIISYRKTPYKLGNKDMGNGFGKTVVLEYMVDLTINLWFFAINASWRAKA